MKLSQIKARIDSVHAAHKNWWLDLETGLPKQRNVGELLCLVHSEVSEAYDGFISNVKDDHLPEYECWAVEVADALIRLFDLVGGLGIKDEVIHQLESYFPEEGYFNSEEAGDYPLDALFDHHYPQLEHLVPTELYAIIHSSISHCMESHRKNRMPEFHQNLAILICHLLTMMEVMGCDPENSLVEVIDAKVAYNKQRADHKIENRKGEHGKKY